MEAHFKILRRREFLRKWSFERLRVDGVMDVMMVHMEAGCVDKSGTGSCAVVGCGVCSVKFSGFCY
jgi:hypothetical protein